MITERISDERLAKIACTDWQCDPADIPLMAAELQHWRKYYRKGRDLPIGISLDVEKYGIGFAAVTMSGMTRLEPQGISFKASDFEAQSVHTPKGRPPGVERGNMEAPTMNGTGAGALSPDGQCVCADPQPRCNAVMGRSGTLEYTWSCDRCRAPWRFGKGGPPRLPAWLDLHNVTITHLKDGGWTVYMYGDTGPHMCVGASATADTLAGAAEVALNALNAQINAREKPRAR